MNPDQTPLPKQPPWLSRPQSIRVLWIAFGLVLAITVLAQLFVHLHGHFALEELFGFNAVYGFLTCVAMVVFAKGLGMLLKRGDTYYEPPSGEEAGDDD